MAVPIISVTGTKGKTTTVAVIADVLQSLGHNVLKVDTMGHYVNGLQKSTLEESKQTWRLVPTVCPGRFMWEFHAHPSLRKNGVAVLECALGSSNPPGLGYRNHNVGVFLNVFEDHIGSTKRLKTRADIAKSKEFIYSRLDRDKSYAVFNADDKLVCKSLSAIPASTKAKLVPCGVNFSYFDLKSHLQNGGIALTVKADKIVLLSGNKERELFDLKAIPWTFQAAYKPSIQNLLFAAGAVIAHYGGNVPKGLKHSFETVRLDPEKGRLVLLESKNGVKILADYAHEKVSLGQVADLMRDNVNSNGRLIGVVRMAPDRTRKLITETGGVVGKKYDYLIVYDKIDGYWRSPRILTGPFPEKVGKISKILYEGVKVVNPNVERILREDKALARAAQIAKPGDAVVIIVNDDMKRSLQFIKKYFGAKLV